MIYYERNYASAGIVQGIDCFMENRRTNKINSVHRIL